MDTASARRIPVPRVLDRLAAPRAKRDEIDAEETTTCAQPSTARGRTPSQ